MNGRIWAPVAALFFLAGCLTTEVVPLGEEVDGKGQPVGGSVHTDTFIQGETKGGYADLLFVVDNSGSMYEEQALLAQSFSTFINWIIGENVDFHIAVTTTDMMETGEQGAFVGNPKILRPETPDLVAAFQNNVNVGDLGSWEEKGLDAARAALSEPNTAAENAGFLRDNANLYLVFVTDEEEQSADSIHDFIDFFGQLKGDPDRVHYTAIAGPVPTGCQSLNGYADASLRYDELITTTGGLFGSICQEDFGVTLQELAFEVIAAASEYHLTKLPIPSTIEVFVEGAAVPATDWVYHSATNSVEIMEPSIPNGGDTITITYEVEGGEDCLANGEVIYDLDGEEGSWSYFKVCVEAAAQVLVHTWDGKGDPDLYVKAGDKPGEDDWDARSTEEGVNETLLIDLPAPGEWYVGVYGYQRFEGLNVQAVYYGEAEEPEVDHLLISKVAYDIVGTDALGEFVELYNPTQADISLDGWELRDGQGGWSLPAGLTLAPGATLTVARDSAGFEALHGQTPDVTGMTLGLGNNGDQVEIVDAAGLLVDNVAWEGFITGWNLTAGTGDILVRDDLGRDTDTASDWVVQSGGSGNS
jgi:hypothetical protein